MNKEKLNLLKFNKKIARALADMEGFDTDNPDMKKYGKKAQKLWELIKYGEVYGYEICESWEKALGEYAKCFEDCVAQRAVALGEHFHSKTVEDIDKKLNKNVIYILNDNDVLMDTRLNRWTAFWVAFRMQIECLLSKIGFFEYAPGFESSCIYLIRGYDRMLKYSGMTEKEFTECFMTEDGQPIVMRHNPDWKDDEQERESYMLQGKYELPEDITDEKFAKSLCRFLERKKIKFQGHTGLYGIDTEADDEE